MSTWMNGTNININFCNRHERSQQMIWICQTGNRKNINHKTKGINDLQINFKLIFCQFDSTINIIFSNSLKWAKNTVMINDFKNFKIWFPNILYTAILFQNQKCLTMVKIIHFPMFRVLKAFNLHLCLYAKSLICTS